MSIEWPTPNVLIACFFNVILAILSFFTTSLAIIAYFRSLTIRQSYQNLLFLNLLINAMIFTILSIIFNGYGAIMRNLNILSIEWVCYLDGFINLFCGGMEMYSLMCIALDRYFAIVKQRPLTKNQIIGLLMFGWLGLGLLISVPLWNSSFYYGISPANFYCAYPFADRTQIITAILCLLHGSSCVSVISFCYMEIYRYCMHLKKSVKENMNSTITESDSKKDNEFRILWTTIFLVGWTFIGWTPMLLMIAYQVMTGNSANYNWDIVTGSAIIVAVCGDSIILLVYDTRWKASLREMISNISQYH